jgi:hypothetical protein
VYPGRTAARGFRLTAPRVAEDDFHIEVAKVLGLFVMPPAEWTCFPAGNVELPAHAAAKLSRMGLQRGWPDFLLSHNGLFGLELKADGGGLSRTKVVRTKRGTLKRITGQTEMFQRLRASGACVAVARDMDSVLLQLNVWAIPLRSGWRSALTCEVQP